MTSPGTPRPGRGRALAAAVLLLLASSACGSGGTAVLRIEVSGREGPAAGGVLIEVVPAGREGAPAWKGDAEAARGGIPLPPGRYRVYVEDQETGLILAEPEAPGGRELPEGTSVVTVRDLARRVEEIRRQEGADRGSRRSRGSVPGELLIRFSPETGLAERRAFLRELGAEPLTKIRGLDLYRVSVPAGADLDRLIAAHGKDHRVLYVEKNQVLSVPEPPKRRE